MLAHQRDAAARPLLLCLVVVVALIMSAAHSGAMERTKGISGAEASRPSIACPPDGIIDCSESLDPSNTGWPIITGGHPPYDTTYADEVTEQRKRPFTYVIVRTWTVTDASEEIATCRQMIEVSDTEPPTFLYCPPDTTVTCVVGLETLPSAVVVDNCDPEPEIRYEATKIPGHCRHTYLILREWHVMDNCANLSTCQQTVRFMDVLPPTLECAPDEVLACNQPASFKEPSVSDNCDESPVVRVVSEVVEPGPGTCQETHRKCWEAEDRCGNISERRCQTIVTTTDTQPPELASSSNKRVEWGEPIEFAPPRISDNCDDNPIVGVTSDTRFTGPKSGESTFTRCWQAQDACGNVSGEGCQSIIMGRCPLWFCAFGCWDWASACLDGENHDISTRPACVRDEYFDEIFPNGVRIGATDGPGRYEAVWMTPEEIEEFMCGYGIPAALERNYVSARRNQIGVLAGELLALRLNREYSCYGAFSSYGYDALSSCYGIFTVPANVPKFAGLNVDEFLAVADAAISGDADALRPYRATYSQLYGAAAYLNWLFSDCEGCGPRDGNGPLLTQTDGDDSADEGPTETIIEDLPNELEISSHPNPLQNQTTLRLALPSDCEVVLEIYDVRGKNVATVYSGPKTAGCHDFVWKAKDNSGSPVVSGVYFCRVEIEGQPVRLKKLVKM
jgi:hypothetical protein